MAQLLGVQGLFLAAGLGSGSILQSFTQTALGWGQATLFNIGIAVAIPSFLLSIYVTFRHLKPKGGFFLMAHVGFHAMCAGFLLLCFCPWAPFLIFLALALVCFAILPAFCGVLFLVIKHFPQEQQAQAQGLEEITALFCVGPALPFWTFVLYDEHADDEAKQALPFFVSFGLSVVGILLLRHRPATLRNFEAQRADAHAAVGNSVAVTQTSSCA